jgi:hypothetical protein
LLEIPIPNTVYCPKCGTLLNLEKIDDPKTVIKLQESGYAAGARGLCDCGVTAVLAIKKMPENPTFSLLFNIYKLEVTKKSTGE